MVQGRMSSFKKNSFSSGFTLVELVVVIVLLGIMAFVAVPIFFDIGDYRQRAAYDEVAGAIRYAQKLAVASGCEVQVALSGNSYALQQHATDCTNGAFATISDHPVTAGSFSDVTLTPAPGSFIFDPMGRSDQPVTVGVGGRTISVIAETGYVDAP